MATESKQTREEMPKAYNPAAVEGPTYRRWEESGAFTPPEPPPAGKLADGQTGKEPYTIVMPPPNLTGELHLGHALGDSIEDLLVRWRRMQGRPALWLPGVDHAAIAVHTLIERQLSEEGLSRRDIGREAFLERTWEFVRKNRARIAEQHKRLGDSADWSRELFTMDPGPALAVRTIFVRLFEKGLVYRGNRLINWCPGCQSALSDLEVDHVDEDSFLWHVKYPLIDMAGKDTGEFITIATTRPETIMADTAIAVHPGDGRYTHLRGAKARVPVINREIPIIEDEAIDPEFGSGALKVTPGHDQTDFEIGERHGLPIVNVMQPDGTLNEEAGPYAGVDRFEARKRIVADLKAQGLLEREEPYRHSIGVCDRCGSVVEPLMSEQWFVAMSKEYEKNGATRSISGDALKAVSEGWTGPSGKTTQIKMVPERHTKVYQNWLENIRDWCISRQLWWGHRIPVWYCEDEHMTVAVEDPTKCATCGSTEISQDEDTLDTWFSSALWPFSTLGWPEETQDLRYFYPTSVMETGYDIIFLWVTRMIMMGIFATDEAPFEWVYFHGTVRDDRGQRMSKSKGNGVDPEVLIDRYGSDALRFKLITAGGTGNDQRLEEPRIEAARNFANKLWNASRFVLSQLEPGETVPALDPSQQAMLPTEDRWILSRLERLTGEADRLMERFELGEAGREIEEFVWDELCDWYLEIAKVRQRSDDEVSPLPVLVHVLDACLRLLHPFMPYVTEEIWSGSGDLRGHLPDPGSELVMTAAYPAPADAWRDEAAEREIGLVLDIVRAVRNIRRERGIDAGTWIDAYVVADGAMAKHGPAIEQLARVRPLRIVANRAAAPSESVATAVLAGALVVLPLAGLFDFEAERAKLQKQRAEEQAQVERLETQLRNDKFTSGAPAQVVADVRERLEAARGRIDGLEARLAELQ
ncbi:MAG TPA: valine--tRNA ligase [Dehalococcoidia bacterium]|nr:valine--tRNA ligase [Dehalococcoidia bacterium]